MREICIQPRDIKQVELWMNVCIRERHVLLKADLSRFNVDSKEHRKLSMVFFASFGRAQ